MTFFTFALSVVIDPSLYPRQKGERRPGQKESCSEIRCIAYALSRQPRERARERAGQAKERAQQGILGGRLSFLTDAHEKGEERCGAEPTTEGLNHGRAVHKRWRRRQSCRRRVGQI